MEKIIISCLESRVETNRSIYARFLLGPFKDDNAVTIATALRRSLLSKVKSIAITAIHIQGVTHEFSTIAGVRESVLDLALNFQQVVLRTKEGVQRKRKSKGGSFHIDGGDKKRKSNQTMFGSDNWNQVEAQTIQVGYLQMQGPGIVYANDLKLPVGIECVDPTQYIATLSTEGLLVVKFVIGKKKASFDSTNVALTGEKLNVGLGTPKQGFVNTQKSFIQLNNLIPYPSNLSINSFKSFDPTVCLRNTIFLDPIFDSVIQANYVIEKDDLFNQVRERVVLEFWTNGSVHPRQALHEASLSLISTFSIFRKVFYLDSL